MRKRLIVFSIVLVLAAVFLLPMAKMNVSAATILGSGECGDNLTWSLTDDGTLTIKGTGNMWSYSGSGNGAPWKEDYSLRTATKSIVIEEGVTSIGNSAFSGSYATKISIPSTVTKIGEGCFFCCDSLRSVSLPYGIKSIPATAFYGCESLETVNIPDTVQSFGYSCFSDCSSLQYFIIPDGVKKIAYNMFCGCSSLEYVQIPKSVTEIDTFAFHECGNLCDIYYTGTRSQYNSIEIESLEKWNEGLLNATIHYSSRVPCTTCNYTPYTKTDDTYHSRTCQNCEKVEKNYHSWNSGIVTKQPTCKDTGVKTYTCSVCNGTKTETLPKTEAHTYGGWSYKNDTYHKQVCTLCGNEKTSEHSWSTGSVDASCSVCSAERYMVRPVKPIVTGYTSNSVTLMPFDGYEYSINGNVWQISNQFNGLTADTSYTFYQRIAKTATSNESASSESVTVKTLKTSDAFKSTTSNYDKLSSYLTAKGGQVKYSQTGSTGTKSTVKITKVSSGIEFWLISESESSSSGSMDVSLGFVLTKESTDISVGMTVTYFSSGGLGDLFDGEKKIDRSTYSSSTTYPFYMSGVFTPSTNFTELFNTGLETLCIVSDALIYPELGFGLKGLGFLSYSGVGSKVCDSPSSYHTGYEIRCKWDAGCTYDGYTGDKYCTGCNMLIEKGSSITCAGLHKYDDECDNTCNNCGEVRKAIHSFTGDCDKECNLCNAYRKTETEHTFDDKSDRICNVCGSNRCKTGDLTGDDSINSLDGLLLMRYLNGWNVDINYPEAMDINGDGLVNSLDGLLLMRYLNGWNVSFIK